MERTKVYALRIGAPIASDEERYATIIAEKDLNRTVQSVLEEKVQRETGRTVKGQKLANLRSVQKMYEGGNPIIKLVGGKEIVNMQATVRDFMHTPEIKGGHEIYLLDLQINENHEGGKICQDVKIDYRKLLDSL